MPEDSAPRAEDRSRQDQAGTIHRLLILNQVSMAMQSTLDLEQLLHIILSGVTAGEALGFNRAMLFLTSEDGAQLEGRIGVGPINLEECQYIWAEIFSQGLQLEDFLKCFGQVRAYQSSELARRTQELKIPLKPGTGILARTVLERRSFVIGDAETNPEVNPAIRDLLRCQEFATAPLIAAGEVYGAILVDNRFTRRPIESSDLQILSLFANQAAAGVRNARQVARIQRFNEELEVRIKQATRELESANQQLVKNERLAFLGEMAAIVAHEIRNPLTAVKGFAQRIRRKTEGNAPVDRYCGIIVEEVDRLDAVIADVLDYARRAEPKRQEVDLAQVLRQTIDIIGAELDQGRYALSVELNDDLPRLQGDPDQLKQVFLNICQNALKAMPEGGALGIEATCQPGAICVSIRDTGKGIPESLREKIFQPFFTTRSQGTGLGLSLAQQIVEDHGGTISLESVVGEGTTFRILLPVTPGTPQGEETDEAHFDRG